MGNLTGIAYRTALAASLSLPAIAQAESEFAGWWIAIDDTVLEHREATGGYPMEELLIVSPDGRFENRMMPFSELLPAECLKESSGQCSDAPLLSSGRLDAEGHTLVFRDIEPGGDVVAYDGPRLDAQTRAIAASGIISWVYYLDAVGDGRLELMARDEGTVRVFARIDPDRLRALRAAFRASGLAIVADDRWRCFLGNAMSGAAPFDGLSDGSAPLPEDFDDYLHAISYLETLAEVSVAPIEDDPIFERAVLADVDVEYVMLPQFDDLTFPSTIEERDTLMEHRMAILQAALLGTPDMGHPLTQAQLEVYAASFDTGGTFYEALDTVMCSQ